MKDNKSNVGLNLLLINAFVYISFSLYTPFLTAYYSKSGINAVEIGILSTIGPLIAIVIQPIWAIISDRTGRKKDILSFVVLGSAISIFSYYFGHTFLTFFIATVLLSIFCTSIVPLSDAILLRTAHKMNLDFSKIRLGGTVGYALFVILAGTIVKQKPSVQFALGSIGFMALLLFVRRLPKDTFEKDTPKAHSSHKVSLKTRLNILRIFESKQIFFILAFAFVSQVGLSFHYSFLGVYMTNLGFGEGVIGFINSVSAFSEVPILFLINRIMKKVNTKHITVLSCLLLGVRILTVTGANIGFIVLAQAMHGLTYMTIYYSCAVFISKNVKPENQSQGQSILAIVQTGLGSIVGNILGGFLVDRLGLKQSYITMSIVIIFISAVIALVQFLVLEKKRGMSA